jgi:cyanophycin synthetase
MPGLINSSKAATVKWKGNLRASLAASQLAGLRTYYLLRRGLSGSMNPETRRMRGLRDAFYASVWEEAAAHAGARVTALSDRILEISKDDRSLRVSANTTSIDDPVTLALAGDKPAVHRILRRAGIPVPPHLILDAETMKDPGEILRRLKPPLVVKPAADTGAGMGVSTNVRTRAALTHAISWARAFGPRVLVEAQIVGECYRILLFDGEVVDAVLRRSPCVTGDGVSSVSKLIARENALRLRLGIERAQVLIRKDPDLLESLRAQGLRLRSTPADGVEVRLKTAINDNRADENECANDRLCPDVIETGRRAAALLGLRLAGVDVICADPGIPLEASGGAVIDVNASPGFHYHYHRAGPGCAVADRIVEHIFASRAARPAVSPRSLEPRSLAHEH